jgi:hypothetical protein
MLGQGGTDLFAEPIKPMTLCLMLATVDQAMRES